MRYYPFSSLLSPDIDLSLNNAWAEFVSEVDYGSEKAYMKKH